VAPDIASENHEEFRRDSLKTPETKTVIGLVVGRSVGMRYITTGDVVMRDSFREATSKMREPEDESSYSVRGGSEDPPYM
jgi:hypothetical protein